MSTYRASTASLNASIASVYSNANNEHEAVLHGMCSTSAVALSAELRAAPPMTIADVQHAWAKVDVALPGWQQHLPVSALTALDATQHDPSGIGDALDHVARALAAQERLVVADASISALTALGYSVQRVDGTRTSAIEARRGHETFLVVSEDQGKVTTDHAGLADDSCNDRQREYVDAMRQRGVLLDDEITVQHHDPRGGSPIANAARAGGSSLAEGAVLDGDARPASLVASLLPATTAAKRQRISAGGVR